MKKSSFATALALGFLATSTLAQQNLTAEPKFYVGAELGTHTSKDYTKELTSTLVSQVGGTATASQDSTVSNSRIFGGFNINENVGLELGYSQTGSYGLRFSGVSRTAVAYSGNASAKFGGLDYSVLFRPSISTGLNGLFFRLGGHTLDQKTDVRITAGNVTVSNTDNHSGTGALYGFGYDLKLSNTWGMRISYTSLYNVAGLSGNDGYFVNIGVLAKF